jgi:hypothetical protein
MAAGVNDMPTHEREPGSVKDLTAHWKEASPMSNRDRLPCGVQRGPDRLARRHAGLEKQLAGASSAAARLGPPSGAAVSAHHPTGP